MISATRLVDDAPILFVAELLRRDLVALFGHVGVGRAAREDLLGELIRLALPIAVVLARAIELGRVEVLVKVGLDAVKPLVRRELIPRARLAARLERARRACVRRRRGPAAPLLQRPPLAARAGAARDVRVRPERIGPARRRRRDRRRDVGPRVEVDARGADVGEIAAHDRQRAADRRVGLIERRRVLERHRELVLGVRAGEQAFEAGARGRRHSHAGALLVRCDVRAEDAR